MNIPTKIIVLGRDHEAQGDVYIQSLDSEKIALGTSVGIISKPNEDCVGLSIMEPEIVLAIADGHWGRDASEIAVSKAVELLGFENRASKDSETRARLFAVNEQVNVELYDLAMSAPGASASETTLIVCHVKEMDWGKYLYWSSFGDSFLFKFRNRELQQLNTLNARWLGYLSKLSEGSGAKSIVMRFMDDEARYAGVANGLETGIEKLERDDILFLCTDGLTGSDVAPAKSVLDEISNILSSDLSHKLKAEELISSALKRGEVDKVSCIVEQIT
jgi:serine/threonine protein phosphatase PrpC